MKIPVFVIKVKNNKYYFEKLNGMEIINESDYRKYAELIRVYSKTKNACKINTFETFFTFYLQV